MGADDRNRVIRSMTDREKARFWSKIDIVDDDSCWLWTRGKNLGYGLTTIRYQNLLAHRVAYELLVGQIPDGLQVDHLCRVRACCNPAHLEPVTAAENMRRSGPYSRKTHCPHGHAYDEQNTYHRADGHGRQCRACVLALQKQTQQEKRARRRERELRLHPAQHAGGTDG